LQVPPALQVAQPDVIYAGVQGSANADAIRAASAKMVKSLFIFNNYFL